MAIPEKITPTVLKETHDDYKEFIDEWKFNTLCYENGMPFIRHCLKQHPRETAKNWKQRVDEGYSFNYGEAIIDLYNLYLFEKPFHREIKTIEDLPQWKLFERDADQHGTNYDVLLNNAQKLASVTGAVGILVNKFGPKGDGLITEKDEIDNGIYPYVTFYTQPNILDWHIEKDPETGRPRLYYLKLREKNGRYLLFFETRWELWELRGPTGGGIKKVDSGELSIDEIPFFWMPNIERIGKHRIGRSDLSGISDIIASIVRDLSYGEEIIKFAGFPMMRKPMRTAEQVEKGENQEDLVGVRGVLEFNPEHGKDGKPDWLESAVLEPIQAVLDWIDRKGDEIYRVKHLSGVHGQRKSNNEVASGLALRYEFQQLNAVLRQKAVFLCEADLNIIRLFLKWIAKDDLFKDAKVSRSDEYSVEDLSIALENVFSAIERSTSTAFKRQLEKKAVRLTLPEANEKTVREIHSEIDTATYPDPVPASSSGSSGGSESRSSDQAD